MFEGHTDVVTEGDRRAWSFDPYGAELRDGRIHGRGSADMKGGVAAMIHAVRALELAGPFPGRVVVAALVDEEGLMLGAKHFARTPLAAEVDGVIVCEPEGGEVCAVAKGAIRLRLDLDGCDGARRDAAARPQPDRGRARDPRVRSRRSSCSSRTTSASTSTSATATSRRPCCRAGDLDQINVIPARCSIALDIRTVPGVDHAALDRRRRGVGRALTPALHDVRLTSRGDRRPAAGGHAGRPPGGAGAGRGARARHGEPAVVRRGPGRDRRHDPHPRRRPGHRGLRTRRQVDRAPGRRVRRGRRRGRVRARSTPRPRGLPRPARR